MKDYNALILLSCISILSSCAGDDDSNQPTLRDDLEYSGPTITDENRDVSVADITGIWEFEVDHEGLQGEVLAVDEYTLVITPEGDYLEYDYKGDSHASNNGDYANCFDLRVSGTINKHHNGGFNIKERFDDIEGFNLTFTTRTNYERQGETLLAAGYFHLTDCKCDTPVIVAQPATLTVQELESKLCN